MHSSSQCRLQANHVQTDGSVVQCLKAQGSGLLWITGIMTPPTSMLLAQPETVLRILKPIALKA